MAAAMEKNERVRAALRGQEVDRPPFCFWHHFRPCHSARALAEDTVAFFGRYDLDIYKVMPDLPYPFPRRGIRALNDWHLLTPLRADQGNPARVVDTVRRIRRAVGPSIPLVVTVFSPLTEATNFAGHELILQHMREDPATVHGALDTIAETLANLGFGVLEAGADGLYVGNQAAGNGLFTPQQYIEFGRPYDLRVLNAASEAWLHIMHVHGEHDLLIDQVLDYPVAAVSWSDRLTGLPLKQVWSSAPRLAVMGGMNEQGAIVHGPTEEILAEMRDAVAQTGGRRHILAPGCSVPDDCPEQWLHAARDAVDHLA